MDGKDIIRTILDCAESNELPNNLREDKRILYKLADIAACRWCDLTAYLVKTGSIATVDGTQVYDLPYDFLRVFPRDPNRGRIVRYYDGSVYSFPREVDFEEIFYGNETDEKSYPMEYCIKQAESAPALVTGTVDATGALSVGQTLLNDIAGLFLTTNKVNPRDTVHNTTDASDGIVLSVTDASNLQTALFGGAANCWTLGDAYVIQREPLQQLYLDSPSSTTGHAISIPYIAKPAPVYNDYGFWSIPDDACIAICQEALFDYLTRAGKVAPLTFHKTFKESVWNYTRYMPKGKGVNL